MGGVHDPVCDDGGWSMSMEACGLQFAVDMPVI